jgi:radical SAM superfamily enzyme YgiQ (UPF0313 family)
MQTIQRGYQPESLPIQTHLSKRVLLIHPQYPNSFWSFEEVLEMGGKKALLPPLNLITVAAILPQNWEYRLIDHAFQAITEEDWTWADLVIISGMIVQKPYLLDLVQAAKQRGKTVAVGGPYATALPQEVETAGADFLVLDEGEITLPLLVQALEKGESKGIFREAEKPDVTLTPAPRYDLLDLPAYGSMSVQFSRGCPFQCEFCDIIVLYGRKPRTKTPAQILGELQVLYDLGWRSGIFMVDDNFIGNKRNVKLLLQELKTWQFERDYPFGFMTEASINLADDEELMDLMVACSFYSVFVGIESPDEANLTMTKKFQNTRSPMLDSIDRIYAKGMRIVAGFIIGFDGEKKGSGSNIVEFITQAAIPYTTFALLQALPNTALWDRLEKDNRLLEGVGTINQSTLTNFVPTRPIEDILAEYLEALDRIFDPANYLDRTYDQFMRLGTMPHHLNREEKLARRRRKAKAKNKLKRFSQWQKIKVALTLIWRQGIKRSSRFKFWGYLFSIWRHKPDRLYGYLDTCAHNEHFIPFTKTIRAELLAQLPAHLEATAKLQARLAQIELEQAELEKVELPNAS